MEKQFTQKHNFRKKKLKTERKMKTRKELIDYIYNHSKEEFITLYEVFQLAKETKKQLREIVKSIQEYYELNSLVE